MAENKILFSSGGVVYSPVFSVTEHTTNMTSDTTPVPLMASASSQNTANLSAFRVFDGIGLSRWDSNGAALPQWVDIDFGQNKMVNAVEIKSSGSSSNLANMPKHFTVEASNNNADWSIVGEFRDATWSAVNETKKFFLGRDCNFKRYRIMIHEIENKTQTIVRISQILFSYYDAKFTPISSASENDFLSYGVDIAQFSTFQGYKLYDLPSPVDILYYTDVTSVTSPTLEKTLNYSPLDELDGDIEFISLTEQAGESRNLELTGVPVYQFISLLDTMSSNDINAILSTELAEQQIGEIKYVISPDNITWHSYQNSTWITVDTSDKMDILQHGMTKNELDSLQKSELQQIISDKFSIGVLIKESFRVNENIGVDKLEFGEAVPTMTAEVNNMDMYILNTTAEINVTFAGNTLTGDLDDADAGKVQYSVILNGAPYYPADGSFTILEPSPANLRLSIDPNQIIMGQNNNLTVLFRDAWGSTDTWQTSFIGTMSGLLFTDINGNYYSTEQGTVLQQLDFGTIIAGQTTLEHEIRIKNTYGYTVENIKIAAKQQNFPIGMKAQFGTNQTSFEALDELVFNRRMLNGEEIIFFVRLTTNIITTATPTDSFDIEVTADKVI